MAEVAGGKEATIGVTKEIGVVRKMERMKQ